MQTIAPPPPTLTPSHRFNRFNKKSVQIRAIRVRSPSSNKLSQSILLYIYVKKARTNNRSHFKCFHNGIILIVNRFRFCIGKFMVFFNEKQKNMNKCAIISFFSVNLGKISKNHNYELLFRT